MRKGYKVGLFFICAMIAVLAAVLIVRRAADKPQGDGEDNIYDGNGAADIADGVDDMSAADEDSADAGSDDVETQNASAVTTCDTVCIYENIDKKDGTVSTEEAKLPAKYIGLTREQLEAALQDDGAASTLEDKEKGFISQHLELFSTEKIKILRIYDTTVEQTGFYIMEIDGEIGVYRQDRTTLYFKTGLDPDTLPEDVKRQVREGKYLETELQVYHFLESYSS